MNDERDDDFEEHDIEEYLEKNEIEKLIENDDLVASGGEFSCSNCNTTCEIYCHKYDEDWCAITCPNPNCGEHEWITDKSANNPNRCQSCEDFVTDEEVSSGKGLICVAVDEEGEGTCEQRAHQGCVEYCEVCGYLCEDESNEYLECSSCGKLHDQNHFVAFGSDFVDQFGMICEDCFYDDTDEFRIEVPIHEVGTHDEEENDSGIEIGIEVIGNEISMREPIIEDLSEVRVEPIVHMAMAGSGRKRSDQSTYLSHFVKQRDEMTDDDCFEQLKKIINDKKLEARPTGYFSVYNRDYVKTALSKAVCLTEGRLSALKDHADQYSYFGLAISKYKLMRDFKCAPCIYINEQTISVIRDNIPNELVPFVNKISIGSGIDYHHEREWRSAVDVIFEHAEINFIFAPKKYHELILRELDQARPVFCIDTIINL